jgi:hypothetical protein
MEKLWFVQRWIDSVRKEAQRLREALKLKSILRYCFSPSLWGAEGITARNYYSKARFIPYIHDILFDTGRNTR